MYTDDDPVSSAVFQRFVENVEAAAPSEPPKAGPAALPANKELARKLPPHRPYDLAIKLKSDAELSHFKPIPLHPPEAEACQTQHHHRIPTILRRLLPGQFLFVFLSRASVPQGYVDPGYFRKLCDAALIKRQRFEALVRRLMWGLQIDRRLTKMSTEVEAVARFVTSLFEMTTFQFHSNPTPTQDQHDALRIMFCRFEQVALIGGKRIVPSEICDGLYDAYLSICAMPGLTPDVATHMFTVAAIALLRRMSAARRHMLGTILMFCLSVSYRPGFVDFHRKAVALAVGPCVLDFGNPEVHMTDMAWRIFSTLVSNGNVIALYICGQHANTPLPAADVRTAANTGTGAAGQCDGGDSAAQVENNARKPQSTKAAEVPDAASAINNPLATMDELAANGPMTAGMMRAFHVELDEECSEDMQHTDGGLESDHTPPSAAELLQGSNSNMPLLAKDELAAATLQNAEPSALGTQDAQPHNRDAAPVKLCSDKTLITVDESNCWRHRPGRSSSTARRVRHEL
ncbi:hypothetical protein HK105_207895 [Polyrhizophydium stewartii]|uniref:Uncharacterized protein n=1 Tax=Polyrhizophydium stewartii TaxID=2732419 RepID=A0ABR4MZ92_9FUNG